MDFENFRKMTPEQLDFNQKMLSFLGLFGIKPEMLEKLPSIIAEWDGFVEQANSNFKRIGSDNATIAETINKILEKVPVDASNGKTPLESLQGTQVEEFDLNG